jgi:Predicted membrane protein
MLFFQFLGECIREEFIYIFSYLILVNLAAFIMYRIDKKRSKRNACSRIPESAFIGMATIGGGLGSIFGMLLFHHKTRHAKFIIAIPLLMIIWSYFLAQSHTA